MELTPIPVSGGGVRVPGRCVVRGQRLVQVKFVALPPEKMVSDTISDSAPASTPSQAEMVSDTIFSLINRVIGRLVAARP